MQYMITFSEPMSEFAKRDDPAHAPAYWGAWQAYVGAMNAAGIVVSGNGLQAPETATIVTIRDGNRHVQDGPFADTKEAIGGYFIVDVPDLVAVVVDHPPPADVEPRVQDGHVRVPQSDQRMVARRLHGYILSAGPPHPEEL